MIDIKNEKPRESGRSTGLFHLRLLSPSPSVGQQAEDTDSEEGEGGGFGYWIQQESMLLSIGDGTITYDLP